MRCDRHAVVVALGIACGLALGLRSNLAHAEDRPAAERYFRAGAKAYAAQNFGAAAENFDEAYKAMPLPEIAFSAAQAFRKLYHVDPKPEYVRRAVELYRAYLAQVKTGGRVGDAVDNLAEMSRELDKLKAAGASTAAAPVVSHTRLGVSVIIADQSGSDASTLREIGDATGDAIKGVTAKIDGKSVEPFALVDVEAKDHVVSVAADGYFPVEKKTVAIAGQSTLVEVELKARPARVVVKTEDDARIAVDGRAVVTAPSGALEIAAGKHLLTIVRRGREPFGREIVVTRGQDLVLAAPLAKTGRRRAVPWVLGGAALLTAGAVTTGILAAIEDGRASDLHTQIMMGGRPPGDADLYDHAVTARDHDVTATWILGGAAVAAAAVGTILLVFDTPSAETIHVTPIASPGSTGLSVSGRF